MNEVHLPPVGEFDSLHAEDVVHNARRFGGQPETGRNHLVPGMAHVADVDRGNTRPDNQAVGTDQPEDPGIIVVPPEEPATPDANQGLDPVTGEPLPMGG